jgi:2-iminobutanoate/2-iminopropanoate deaminase
MELSAVLTEKAPAAIGPYSQAIVAGGWVFVSGQIPLVPETGELIAGAPAAQFERAMENLRQVLAAAGCGLERVVSVDVFLTDISNFAAFNEVYGKFFSSHKPARAVVEVKALPRGAMVEVKCVACRG